MAGGVLCASPARVESGLRRVLRDEFAGQGAQLSVSGMSVPR